ncbi:MAG: PTS sugar transporter [Desulfobacteraceae bacterium]|nr:MAG: PTS sugar transporter [Desulfobacteraceae bacterium]
MIGLLIVTHCDLGKELLHAAEFIVGRIEAADTVAVTETTGSEKMHKEIEQKIKALNKGQGVLVLTDMFGGTPSNLSLSFLDEKVEVLTGVNLPMVIAIVQNRQEYPLKEIAAKAQEAGKIGISLAGKLLESG